MMQMNCVVQIRGYYLAAGLNGHGLSLAGGIGRLLADWICDTLTVGVQRVDVARFLDMHANPQYLMGRVPEIAGKYYVI
jgi:hypothetical protein